MKTRYKILIIGIIAFLIYWPGIPLISISCQQITDDEICLDLASIRILNPVPSSNIWNSEPEITLRYEKYLDENNELNFGLQYDKNGIIIDDLQRIHDWCDYSGEKPAHWYFDWNNSTHHINSTDCEWIENEIP